VRTWALILATAVVALSREAQAFHEKGTANCNGCHITHTGEGGESEGLMQPLEGGLLIAESPSDVCLTCHAESLGAVLGLDPLAPPPERGPGNFVFLLEDNLNDAPGGAGEPVPGDAAGHNIVAPGHGMGADPRYSLAPGGSFPASRLGCTSCHDPHGNADFRLLRGRGPLGDGSFSFAYPAPDAVGTALDSGPEGPRSHTAYRDGVSDWCANCHGRYHRGGSGSAFEHPADQALGVAVSERYNVYDGEGDPDGGVAATAYVPDVPFEDEFQSTTSTDGPRPRSRLMCLSCHRAHATSGPAAGRWDFGVPLLIEDGRESGSHPIPSPWASLEQGPLCLKCHETATGEGDGPFEPPEALGPPRSW
jgi:predicted CXXCH cytochrome family protein